MRYSTLLVAVSAGIAAVMAKTDLSGCTSTQVVAFGGASLLYYDPTDGEICSFLDCGGGTAPPKTTVPGCPQYSGTSTYTPDFLSTYIPPGVTKFTPPGAVPASTTAVSPTTTPASASLAPSPTTTPAATMSPATTSSVAAIVSPLAIIGTGTGASADFSSAFVTGNSSVVTPTLSKGANTLTSTLLLVDASTSGTANGAGSATSAPIVTQSLNAGAKGADFVSGGVVVVLAAGVGLLL